MTNANSFQLAPMSHLFAVLTFILFMIPLAFIVFALFGVDLLLVPGLALISLYAWVWLRFRPTRFVVHERALEVIWPLKRREIPRSEISALRMLDEQALQREIGWGLRVGAGGLWGGFGWLWTKNRGIVQMYVSRTDGFIWIDRKCGRPWLITPDRPVDFVQSLMP